MYANLNTRFKILVASDIHLGYAEKDPIRGNDTYRSFEEVLKIASNEEVDFVLLGGDLFHENKPSQRTMTKCIELLRKYCLGDREIKFQIISDQQVNFGHSQFPKVNYEDQNLNISLPVFSIHGNHDDPIGKQPICALDTLSAAGLINYFGKYPDIENIILSPILMTKGPNKIALYGLGSLPEERINRLFAHKKITFLEPLEDSKSWFKILIVHQNRAAHGTKYLPEDYLTNLPDLVIWGHEHESIPRLTYNVSRQFHIFQPGSTVVTSLCAGEAAPKHVGILDIYFDSVNQENKLRLDPILLKTPRKLYFETMILNDLNIQMDEEAVRQLINEKIEDIITNAVTEYSGDPNEPKVPLIRLRVDTTNEYNHLSSISFSMDFKDRVANSQDMVIFKTIQKRKRREDLPLDKSRINEIMDTDERCRIEDVIVEYFSNANEKDQLDLLSEKLLTEAVKEMVDKGASDDRLSLVLEYQLNKTRDTLMQRNVICDEIREIKKGIKEVREEQIKYEQDMIKELGEIFKNTSKGNDIIDDDNDDIDDSDDDIIDNLTTTSTRTISNKRGRGRSQAKGRVRK